MMSVHFPPGPFSTPSVDEEIELTLFSDQSLFYIYLAISIGVNRPGNRLKEELLAFGKAGDLLAILKSRTRRTLKIKPKLH